MTPVRQAGTFLNDDEVIVSFVSTGGSPQPYEFSDSTSTNPADGTLRFDNGTFASITKIYADNLSGNGFDIGTWLDSIDDQDDVRVTVMRAFDDSVLRVFKVNSVVNSSGYRTINVTPVYSNGAALSTGAPIVLICSNQDPIRDRAGALVDQQSDAGFPAGHMLIENCFFQQAVEGVRLSGTAPLVNCDVNTFMHCTFNNCDAGIRCNSAQVLLNVVVNGDFNACKIGIDQVLGGDTRVVGASMSGETGDLFMRIQGGGHNASSFNLYGVRLETLAGKPALLETSETNQFDNVNVVIDSFSSSGAFYPDAYGSGTTYDAGDFVRLDSTIYRSRVSSNHGNSPATSPTQWEWVGDWVRAIRLSENTNCTIRGCIVKGPFADVVGATAFATLKLDHCRLHYLEPDVIATGTNGSWKFEDCTDGSGEPIDNTGNWAPDYNFVAPSTTAQGEDAQDWTFAGADGHSDNGSEGTGGTGSDFRVTLGDGGAGLSSDAGGGRGGDFRVTGGAGGNSNQAAAAAGNGGTIYLQPGAPGTPSGGAAPGTVGKVIINDDQLGGVQCVVHAQTQLDGGTVTSSAPVLDLTQTWNSGGATFTGIRLDISNTASAAGSKLMDLQLDSASKFVVFKDGTTNVNGGTKVGIVMRVDGTTGGAPAMGVSFNSTEQSSLAHASSAGYFSDAAGANAAVLRKVGSAGDLVLSNRTTGDILFATGDGTDTEKLRIESAGALKLKEISSTPSNPSSGTEAKLHVKSDKLIVQFNDGGTVRYKYLDLTGTGATWGQTTTAP